MRNGSGHMTPGKDTATGSVRLRPWEGLWEDWPELDEGILRGWSRSTLWSWCWFYDDKLVQSSENYTPGRLSPTVCKHFNIQNLRSASQGSMLELKTLRPHPRLRESDVHFTGCPRDCADLSYGVLVWGPTETNPRSPQGIPRPGLGFW